MNANDPFNSLDYLFGKLMCKTSEDAEAYDLEHENKQLESKIRLQKAKEANAILKTGKLPNDPHIETVNFLKSHGLYEEALKMIKDEEADWNDGKINFLLTVAETAEHLRGLGFKSWTELSKHSLVKGKCVTAATWKASYTK